MRPIGIIEVAILLLFSALISLILFFFFSMSPSVSQDQTFLGSTYELIMKAKSNPVLVFFACNLIVVAIFLDNSRSPHCDFEWFHGSLSSPDHVQEEENKEANNEEDEDEDEDEEFHGYDGYEEDNDDDGSEDDDDDDLDSEIEGDDDGDLQKRIEEFIAKINRAWRAELMMEMMLPP